MRKTFFLALFIASAAFAQLIPGRYVVELQTAPLGSLMRAPSGTAGIAGRHAAISAEQTRFRSLLEKRNGHVISNLRTVMNAVIVTVPESQAADLRGMPGVKNVYPVEWNYPTLDHALPLHQIPQAWTRIGGMSKAGAGMKIAILDTGISPEAAAFQDSTLKPPAGYPLVSGDENKALVNNKIIVARNYADVYQLTDPDSARDRVGHGTAVATCAAGVPSKGAFTSITGAAPKAFVGAYKITALDSGSASSDVEAKAFDDALSDGMDVINLSFGSAFVAPGSLLQVVIDRTTDLGVIVVTSAGNSGPTLNTIGSPAALARSAIAVGASQNDRYFGGSVSLPGSPSLHARSGVYPVLHTTITAPVVDMATVDQKNSGCAALPEGSFTGKIALVPLACRFETQLNNVQNAGGVAVILYALANAPDATPYTPLTATLPSVMLSNGDGLIVKAAASSENPVTVAFEGIPYANESRLMAGFSSRGPNYDLGLKPDLTATGRYVYTAVQTVNPDGEIYSATGYEQVDGTSFSSPIVAGAAAVLKAARPGLTMNQYRSLLINSANIAVRPDGTPERLQQVGAGTLNLDRALQSTVAAFPTSLSFGTGTAALNSFDLITMTNLGTATETFTVSSIPYDNAAAPIFSNSAAATFTGVPTAETLNFDIQPKQSKTVYVNWKADNLAQGEYQGLINIRGRTTGSTASIPYWYGVPSGVPAAVAPINSLPSRAPAGSTLNFYFRVVDEIGVPVLDSRALNLRASVTAGGGKILGIFQSGTYPNLLGLQVMLSAVPETNTFRLAVANLGSFTLTTVGTTAAQTGQSEPGSISELLRPPGGSLRLLRSEPVMPGDFVKEP